MSEQVYLISKGVRDLEYRESVLNKVPGLQNDLSYRRGSAGRRQKEGLKGYLKGSAVGTGVGAVAGGALGAASMKVPSVRAAAKTTGQSVKQSTKGLAALGGLVGAAGGQGGGGSIGASRAQNRQIKRGDIKLTNRKTGKKVKDIGFWRQHYED